jgi:hypothetical protein
MRKAHAKHNEELCDYLITSKKFNDWVVTSAFYSAVHLTQHQLFPNTYETVKCSTFSTYYNTVIKGQKSKISKHQAQLDLVYKHINVGYGAYRFLLNNCQYARYNSYIIADTVAKKAKESLDDLKKVCTKA